jgi:hypothetical protein
MDTIPSGTHLEVVFTKKDGSLRHLSTLKDLSFGVTGSGAPYNPREKGIVNLYDLGLAKTSEPRDCWRAVRYDSVNELSFFLNGVNVRYTIK